MTQQIEGAQSEAVAQKDLFLVGKCNSHTLAGKK